MTDQNEQNQKSECCGGKCGDHHDHEHQCGCGAKPAAAEGGCGCSDKPAEAAKKETAEPTPQELKAQLKAAERLSTTIFMCVRWQILRTPVVVRPKSS